jgi:hypothetical protein
MSSSLVRGNHFILIVEIISSLGSWLCIEVTKCEQIRKGSPAQLSPLFLIGIQQTIEARHDYGLGN